MGIRNRTKSKQTGPNQTYKSLHSKGNHFKKKEKRQPAEREKMITNDVTDKDLILKIYKPLIQLNNKKTT